MGIHSYDLQICAVIQEKHSLSLEELSSLSGRSLSSVKRSIAAVNEHLPAQQQIILSGSSALFQMSYKEYLSFIQSLTLEDYYPSQAERINIMSVYAFFNQVLNMTHLYETLRFSLTTKKKDSHALSSWLKSQGLSTTVVPKAGIRIVGDELLLRICIVNILSPYLEVDQDFHLTMRLANNPIQSMMTEYFLVKADADLEAARDIISRLIRKGQFRISYASIKFLYLYLGCAHFRAASGHPLTKLPSLPVPVKDYALTEVPLENTFLNHLISALDFSTNVMPPINEKLLSITHGLISQVQERIITQICSDHLIYEEVYTYLHKCIIRNIYHFSFYDNKLEETQYHYHNLYDVIKASTGSYERNYGIRLSHFQIATLTLIFRKFVNKNKLAGRNQKRLVIVTNSSIEKIGFFMEKLKFRVDAKLVSVIHINELYLLKEMEYDCLIVFSNRIASMLEERGYSCLKLNFYLTNEDFSHLDSLGFSTSRRKLKASALARELQHMSPEEMEAYLLAHYSDYFLE